MLKERPFLIVFPLVFLVLLSLSSSCHAIYYSWSNLADFKGMDRYNLFLTGDLKYYRSDVEGRVAVGGNAHLKAFSIGEKAGQSKYSLVVGGRLEAGGPQDQEGGQVNHGGVYAGKGARLNRVGLPHGDVVSGADVQISNLSVEQGSVIAKESVTLKKAFVKGDVMAGGGVDRQEATVQGKISEKSPPSLEEPVKFDELDLEDISYTILNNTGNGFVQDDYGRLFLECTDPLICYFNISATQIENAWGIDISASSQKTVVINVQEAGRDSLRVENMAFRLLGGVRSTNVLYNFYGFKNIEMHNIGLMGSILAPVATVNFFEGNMEGVLMAQNLIGGSWDEDIKGGQINSPVPVPEPSTALLAFLALFILFSVAAFQKRKNAIALNFRKGLLSSIYSPRK